MEIDDARINIGRFGYVVCVNPSILLVSISTPNNGILLILLSYFVKLRMGLL